MTYYICVPNLKYAEKYSYACSKLVRVNKKKNILEFSDLFAPYPETNEDISELILTIKRIRSVSYLSYAQIMMSSFPGQTKVLIKNRQCLKFPC